MNTSEKADVLQEVADEFGHLEDEDGVELRDHLNCWITQLRNKPIQELPNEQVQNPVPSAPP